jgi:hypothetical protein
MVGDKEVTEDRKKADLLLNSFFPMPPQSVSRDSTSAKARLVTRNGSRSCEYAKQEGASEYQAPEVDT